MKIAIIEDDEEIRSLVKYFLEKEKYKVVEAAKGMAGLKLVREEKPDLIVLDVMLPELDGVSICNMIRDMPEKYGSPIILMLTAKSEVDDVVEGLKSGADDYLRKPFDPRELIVRIQTLLKRINKEQTKIHKFGNVYIDEERHVAVENEKEVELSKKEYDLLAFLIKNKGIILTREKIIGTVWDSNYYAGDRTVDVYIGKLREKFETISECIKTVKGVGYKLEEKK